MQQVKRVPLLPVHNWFACLEVENKNPLPPPLHAESPVKVTLESKTTPTLHPLRLHRWEKRLPKQYVVAATPGPKSLVIKVEIQTTDTTEVKSGPALVDCGATGQFMDCDYVERNRLTTQKLRRAIPVDPFVIQPGISKELTSMMQTWLMNKAACPPVVRQEPDNTLNLLDIDFWLWY